jgi:hypothetical protein
LLGVVDALIERVRQVEGLAVDAFLRDPAELREVSKAAGSRAA